MIYSENIKLKNGKISFVDKNGNSLTFLKAIRKAAVRVYNWWLDFEIYIVNCAGYCPFWFWRKTIYLLGGMVIGRNSKIHVFCRFFDLKNISIGDGTIIGERCFLDGRAKLKIGNNVDIASEVLIYNSEHNVNDPDFRPVSEEVVIEDYVFIGPRAIILPGVKIGKGAVVAAGAVVTKNIEAGKIVGGVPASLISERKVKKFNYRLGRTRLFQ